jgi:hypothetical protein
MESPTQNMKTPAVEDTIEIEEMPSMLELFDRFHAAAKDIEQITEKLLNTSQKVISEKEKS